MQLPDVNVLLYAFRPDAPRHTQYLAWLEDLITGPAAYACSDHVLSGFVRVVTNPRAFVHPEPLDGALAFADQLRGQPHCIQASPGPAHWSIFTRLCREVNATGNRVPDAYFAALAIETGAEWMTTDRGYGRFPGLRWRHPLDS